MRKRLVKVFVWSVTQYGSESRVMNNAEKRYLENFFEIKVLADGAKSQVDGVPYYNNGVLDEIGEPRGLLRSITEREYGD